MQENEVLTGTIEKKGNKKTFIGLFVIVVVAVIAIIASIVLRASTPKKVFNTAFNTVFKTLKGSEDEITSTTGSMGLDVNIEGVEENKEIIDIVNGLSLKYDYRMDMKNKVMAINLDTKYKGKDLLLADVSVQDDAMYIYLKDVFDKYISLPVEETGDMDKIYGTDMQEVMKNYHIVLDEIDKALDKALQDKYFKSENVTLKLNGKDEKVIKNILELTVENQKEISESLRKSLNNDTFIKSLAALANEDESAIKDMLENDDTILESAGEFIIYTKGFNNQVVGINIHDDITNFEVLVNKKDEYTYSYKDDETEFDGVVIVKEKSDTAAKVDVVCHYDGMKVTVSVDYSFKYNEKIEKADVTNSISFEELTEEQQQTILMNLMKNDGIIELMQAINKISSLHF